MSHRIWLEKLNLVAALRKLDNNTLAKEVFNSQLELGLPGLIQEAQDICKKISIEDISRKEVTKEETKYALEIHYLKTLREELGDKAKYKEMKKEDTWKIQQFMKKMSLEECCVAMRLKCYMIDCAGYRGREECLKCKPRQGKEGPGKCETQDKVKYFQEVVKEREDIMKRIRKAKKKSTDA